MATWLCPGGKERMRRLIEVVLHKLLDLTPLLTHRFELDRITDAYEVFAGRRDGVLKIAIRPEGNAESHRLSARFLFLLHAKTAETTFQTQLGYSGHCDGLNVSVWPPNAAPLKRCARACQTVIAPAKTLDNCRGS